MKVQISPASLRVRIDEAELGRLLDNASLGLAISHNGVPAWEIDVSLGPTVSFQPGSPWRLQLPADSVRTYAMSLPRRDALELRLDEREDALVVRFEVDVRDSTRVRGARKTP